MYIYYIYITRNTNILKTNSFDDCTVFEIVLMKTDGILIKKNCTIKFQYFKTMSVVDLTVNRVCKHCRLLI